MNQPLGASFEIFWKALLIPKSHVPFLFLYLCSWNPSSLKKVPLLGRPSPYSPLWAVPLPRHKPFRRMLNRRTTDGMAKVDILFKQEILKNVQATTVTNRFNPPLPPSLDSTYKHPWRISWLRKVGKAPSENRPGPVPPWRNVANLIYSLSK